ncbi:MAG: YgaP-like transmembrane domain [Dehalococcoidia bacterium]
MDTAVEFMNRPLGRGARIIAGIVLIGVGITVGGSAGVVIGVVGLVPIALGLSGRCLLELLPRAR